MGKKEKSVLALTKDFQALITMIPKLEAFLKINNEITASYQKYRKNGGASIPGIEKHLGIKIQKSTVNVKAKAAAPASEAKAQKEGTTSKKVIKKVKK